MLQDLRMGPMLNTHIGSNSELRRFRLYVNLIEISGVLIVLLTTLAQME